MRFIVALCLVMFVAAPAIADGSAGSIVATDHAGSAEAAGSAAVEPAPVAPVDLAPDVADLGVMTKLWKSGSFFAFGIMALYLGLFVWSKLDKKRAFYIATGLGAVVVLVEAIRRGETPNAATIASTLTAAIGILIAGPTKAPETT